MAKEYDAETLSRMEGVMAAPPLFVLVLTPSSEHSGGAFRWLRLLLTYLVADVHLHLLGRTD